MFSQRETCCKSSSRLNPENRLAGAWGGRALRDYKLGCEALKFRVRLSEEEVWSRRGRDRKTLEPGLVVYDMVPATPATEARGLQTQSQPGL